MGVSSLLQQTQPLIYKPQYLSIAAVFGVTIWRRVTSGRGVFETGRTTHVGAIPPIPTAAPSRPTQFLHLAAFAAAIIGNAGMGRSTVACFGRYRSARPVTTRKRRAGMPPSLRSHLPAWAPAEEWSVDARSCYDRSWLRRSAASNAACGTSRTRRCCSAFCLIFRTAPGSFIVRWSD